MTANLVNAQVGKKGTGYRQYPDEYLYETLGLYRLLSKCNDLPNAKA